MLSSTLLFVGLSLLSWTVPTMALNIPFNAEFAPQAILSFSKSFEVVSSSLFGDYQLRLTEPHICDTTVKSFSGYLDISQSKHLFFWFFEARHDPKNAPLMLWLNGGPGSSSIGAGLMFENGPCWVNPQGNDTVWNPYSWNEKVNIIYLEEPAGTGYSYIEDDSGVTTLADLAVDVHAFLQLFIHRFPDYAARPFHIAAESWGGHYGPHIANYIRQKNEELDLAPRVGQAKINLASVILANGLTDPLTQFSTIERYLCSDAPYPPYKPNDKVCVGLRLGIPSCLRMIEACYKYQTQTVCSAASAYCWPTYFSAPLFPALTGKNPYDLRQNCTDMGDNLCYDDLAGVHNFLNLTETKLALGVDPDFNFQLTNTTVNQAFYSSGQAVHNSAALLPELVNSGVRLLAYAGDTDGLCNYQGIELWMERLDHRFHVEFGLSSPSPWRTEKTGYFAGTTRSAGIGAGNVTFVRIFDAGHLAPHDQPEASLDLITHWIDDVPFGV